MRTFLQRMWALGVIALMTFSLLSSSEAQASPGDRVSFQTFYDELDPYGRWINDAEYGYVWSPNVEREFQPYGTRGHWVMTEYGNTWVSDYDWGWAPFHYGRWVYDDYEGWLWIPGSEWGPAWVDWRNGGGYYGWAPMGPRVTYVVAPARWIFVPVMYITSPRIYSYCVPRTRVVNIYHNTTIINNYYERDNRRYVYGPRTHDIERATNRKVNVYRVDRDNRPGRASVADNSVRIYRPDVNSRREEAPTRVIARNTSTNRSNLRDVNGSSGRSDRSTNTNRTRVENSATRDRATGEVNSGSRTGLESSSERRSVTEEGGIRTRSGVRRATSPTGENTTRTRPERTDYSQRTSEASSVETRTRTRAESESTHQRLEGSYSPRRMESSTSPEQYQPRTRQESSSQVQTQPRTRSESGSQGQYQQRSRPVTAPSQAPAQQRQAAPRQESTSGRQTSRGGRN